MTSPIISSPHLCKETGSSNARSARRGPVAPPETGSEPSAPECPFCGDEFDVTHVDGGTAFGYCYPCSEMVAAEVAI